MASRNSSAKQGASIDPALPQKKSARRRIIGAAAFFLAAAIILPIVLDSEPRQVRDDIQVRIPSRDLPLNEKLEGTTRQGVIVGAEGAGAPAVLESAPASETSPPAAAAESTPTPTPSAVASPTPQPNGPETAKPASPASAAVVAGAAGAVGAAAVAGAVLSERKDSPAPDGRPAAPKAAAEPSASAKPSPDTRAAAKPTPPPKPAGKPAQDAKPASEAKAAAAKPAPDAKPAPEAKASADARAGTGKIALQLGAFASEKGANEQMERARKAGFKPFTELVHTAQGDRIRVRVGPFPDREAADRARTRLKAAGMASVIVNP